jgi:hypothetical protein
MSKKDKFKEKVVSWFFVDESLSEEERLAEERAENVMLCKGFSSFFLISAIIIFILFFIGKFNIYDGFGGELLMFTIVFGLGALYFDWEIRKADKSRTDDH